jgi:hypothetical protein
MRALEMGRPTWLPNETKRNETRGAESPKTPPKAILLALPEPCERASMVSMAHEVLVDLFKQRPSLAPELLAEALAVPLPAYAEARIASSDLTEIKPAEYRADLVVLFTTI